jgi:16S rRNA (cytosine967-C5)-methyltransferase
VGKKSAALVNAVLRRVAEHAGAAPGAGGGLAAQYSHPDWLVSRWVARFGPDATEALLRHNNRRPPLVLQPVRCSLGELRATLAGAGVEAHESSAGDGLVVEARRPQDLPGYADGGFIVQGPAQARFLREAGIPADALVWDSCAAPGGKAVMLSRDHRVLASDIDRRSVGRLKDSLQRTRAAVTILVADGRHPPLAPGSVDAVWLDAPCTGTGTFARHPDARWRISRRRLLALRQLQRDLSERVAPVVRPGGRLVYTTCSLETEENGERIETFLSTHAEFRRAQPDLLVFPPDTGSDGGYLAVLRKT